MREIGVLLDQICLTVFLILVLGGLVCHGQTVVPCMPMIEGIPADTKYSLVVNRSGWKLPDKSRMKLSGESKIEFGATAVNKSNFVPRHNVNLNFENFDFYRDGEVIFANSMQVTVDNLIEYKSLGHLFAVAINYAPIMITEDRQRMVLGVLMNKLYVDCDGDGKFESLYQNGAKPSAIPLWAQQK